MLSTMNDQQDNIKYKTIKPSIPSWQEFIIVPVTKTGEVGKPQGSFGKYDVIFTFGNPGKLLLNDSINPTQSTDGETRIKVRYPNSDPKTAINHLMIKIKTEEQEEVSYKIRLNNDGNIGNVIIEDVNGQNFKDVFIKSYKYISPLLSLLSYNLDTPIFIKKVDITEKKTQILKYIVLSDETEKTLKMESNPQLTEEQRGILALYREALNSITSPFYQLFCFYRIIEGVYAIRSRLASKGQKITRPEERLPLDSEYIHAGKKFSEIRRIVEVEFRDALAHFSLEEKGILSRSPDNLSDWYDCLIILPELRHITRELINNELNK
jgi:hypothetical protein